MGAHYNVRPRYTAGSPAMVDHDIAMQVADEERRAFERAVAHPDYVPSDTETAWWFGLDFIVERWIERRKGWEIEDVLTRRRWFFPFEADCAYCGAKKVTLRRGELPADHAHFDWQRFVPVLFRGRELRLEERV